MKNGKTMWTFETRNFRIEWTIAPDDYVDLSWDETGETAEKLESGEWTAFESELTVTHKETGFVFGSDYLGGSIYADPADFRDHFGMNGKHHGSYFSDMVRGAIADARETIKKLNWVH